MNSQKIKITSILAITSLVLFFLVYAFYFDKAYFKASLIVNSFIMPVLYAGAGLYSILQEKRKGFLHFKKAFSASFVPQFIAGFLSLFVIFSYLNFVNPYSKQKLNTEFVANNKHDLDTVYLKERGRLKSAEEISKLDADYQKSVQSFTPEQTKHIDIFSPSYFLRYAAAILLFYTLISLFFAAFFRNRSPR